VLLTLGDPGRLTGGYLYHQRMAEAAPRQGAGLAFVSFPERPFPLAAIDAGAILRRAHLLDPDALVLDSIAAAFLGPWLTLRRPERPLVAMLHQPPGGIDHGPPRTFLQAFLDRAAYRHARRLLVASESLRQRMVAEGVPDPRLVVVPPGRDLPPVADSTPLDLRRGRTVSLLSVGNWVRRKGIHCLLEAVARLPEPLMTLHLVGDVGVEAGYARRLRARLARPDLAGRVVVHGPLARERMAALYQAADVFALPSFQEPYGTVYGEAMAFGLPVVGWRAGNLPYLAEHEREGLLVPPGDVVGLSEALLQLALDPWSRRRLGAAARRRALARPTWEESAALFFGAIREALDS
jgi:glycosyltransferase involved in cell wall biosynthesis